MGRMTKQQFRTAKRCWHEAQVDWCKAQKEMGATLRRLRKREGVRIDTLAPLMKCSAGHLSKLETGGGEWTEETIELFKAALVQALQEADL